MDCLGKVLLVDDNEKFLASTATLLGKGGYVCHSEPDGFAAARRLKAEAYDVMVSDIKMDGNENLELLEEVREHAQGLSVILITGYPTVETAVKSLQLPVMAYLVKPFDFRELLKHIEQAVKRSGLMKQISSWRKRIEELDGSLHGLEESLSSFPPDDNRLPLEVFVNLTTQNIIDSITDLKNLISLPGIEEREHICQLYHCPRMERVKQSIRDSVEVLEQTKRSFKSKELALLRKELQKMLSEL